jgi:ABC-type nitrate/sulfonate/bicarbonate transport system permease component
MHTAPRPRHSKLFTLRREIPRWQAVLFGTLCICVCFGIWHGLTYGEPESRRLSPTLLPSISETVNSFHSLWFDRALTRNLMASLQRVALGFGLAIVVGVPIGVLCGCFPWVNAFFAPLTIFGRNIPVAALIPLTFSLFGIGEFQKVMFIFIACIAFVIFDTARSVADIDGRYIDTAYTLGAKRRQIILKVLVPLAMPSIFNSLRLLFGLAFGYIMLAELVRSGGEVGGLGDIINVSQRRGTQTHIMLVLMIIPVVALVIDRLLYWIQCQLFPYQYGGSGMLNKLVRAALHGWESLKGLVIRPRDYQQVVGHSVATAGAATVEVPKP